MVQFGLDFISKEPIHKGWSCDEKYCVTGREGTKYLLRITPEEKSRGRKEMFRIQEEAWTRGVPMCRPLAFGECEGGVYTLQSWIEGEDAETAVPLLADARQYALGLEAGRILKKIHSIPVPEGCGDWESRYGAKLERKLELYRECPIHYEGGERFIEYIRENRHLLRGRPQCCQHGDYHIGNMMLEAGELRIIDFDRCDYGDPWEEFNRIVWTAQAAPLFASGMVNGYFDGQVPEEFWRLLALYIAGNTLSSIPWAIPFGKGDVETMLKQGREILEWYDGMERVVPSWYFEGYYLQEIDGIPYKLKEPFDFGFVHRYGKVFQVFDDQDSGNICFGTEKDGERYFVKFAGAPAERYEGDLQEAVERLRETVPIYKALQHESLVQLVAAEETGGGFVAVFRWAEGDCMGRMYSAEHRRIMALPVEERLRIFGDVLGFLRHVAEKGYVAVDFYDGSILYDVREHKTTICDVDVFRRQPCVNDMGRMWGSSLFQAPEEYQMGAGIDEVTNVYTAGAMAFALFGNYQRTREAWTLSQALFAVVDRAVRNDRGERQQSLGQLLEEWESALREG